MVKVVENNKQKMCCLHGCGLWGVWSSWNHTKAIGHVLGGCSDIKACWHVSATWKEKYRAIQTAKNNARLESAKGVTRFLNLELDNIHDRTLSMVAPQGTAGGPIVLDNSCPPPSASQVSALTAGSFDI